MLSQWHFWAAFFGTGALLVLLAWLGGRRRKLSPKQIAAGGYPAACGSCGYDLTGLPGHICPECGSDLELVGRLSPRFHRWQSVPVTARLIVWTVLIACVAAWMLAHSTEYALPHLQNFEARTTWTITKQLEGTDPAQTGSYSPISIDVIGAFSRRGWGRSYSTHSFAHPDPQTRWLAAYVRCTTQTSPRWRAGWQNQMYWAFTSTHGFAYLAPEGNTAKLPALPNDDFSTGATTQPRAAVDSRQAVLLALAQSNYDGSLGSAESLADSLVPEIDEFLRSGAASQDSPATPWQAHGTANTSISQLRTAPLALLVVGGSWLLVWLLGLPFILRKRPMSIRREAAAETPARAAAA